jgi:hypothetical protein
MVNSLPCKTPGGLGMLWVLLQEESHKKLPKKRAALSLAPSYYPRRQVLQLKKIQGAAKSAEGSTTKFQTYTRLQQCIHKFI